MVAILYKFSHGRWDKEKTNLNKVTESKTEEESQVGKLTGISVMSPIAKMLL